MRVNIKNMKLLQSVGISFEHLFSALICKRNLKKASMYFFLQCCEAFSNQICFFFLFFYCSQMSQGGERVRPLHCNCLVWCASSATGKIFSWQATSKVFFFFYCNKLLQPNKLTAAVFTHTIQQANQHYCSFSRWTMCLLPGCVHCYSYCTVCNSPQSPD